MKPANFYYTIDTQGGTRAVLSIVESGNGTLIIDTKAASWFGIHGESGPPLTRMKVTVHRSLKSPGGNFVHMTAYISGQSPVENYYFTKNIKQTKLFSPILARRMYDLTRAPVYKRQNKHTIHSLGYFDSSAFTLVTCAVLRPPERQFRAPARASELQFNYHNVDFTYFGITLFWGFLTYPSDHSSNFAYTQTFRSDDHQNTDKSQNEKGMNGFDSDSLLDCVYHYWGVLDADYVERRAPLAKSGFERAMVENADLVRVGSIHTWEFQRHLQQFRKEFVVDRAAGLFPELKMPQ